MHVEQWIDAEFGGEIVEEYKKWVYEFFSVLTEDELINTFKRIL